jgi:hypothetical protein
METPKLNLYQKLLVIQKTVNGLGKDKKSFSYSYVTGDKLLGEVKPLMNDLGLILKQEVLSIENTRQDYTMVKDGKERTKCEILSKVEMRFTWIDTETGQSDVNLFGANGQNEWEKGLGSALTYAERYFLLKFFHIATDEDDIDNDQRQKTDTAKVKAEPVKKSESVKKDKPEPKMNPNVDPKYFVEAEKILKDSEVFKDEEIKSFMNVIYKSASNAKAIEFITRIKTQVNSRLDEVAK